MQTVRNMKRDKHSITVVCTRRFSARDYIPLHIDVILAQMFIIVATMQSKICNEDTIIKVSKAGTRSVKKTTGFFLVS